MKLQFLFFTLIPLISKCLEDDVENEAIFRPGVKPYCNEECSNGYEYIPELGHCYRILIDLGPTSQDRGVEACGFAGGYLLSLDEHHDDDIIRNYFWGKYSPEMQAHPNYLNQSGFWTAYMRMAEDGHIAIDKKMFMNMYTNDMMNEDFWRPGNPRNERYDQACVARKWFYREFIGNESYGEAENGLDDYVCGFPHWIICQVRREFALNKRAYNIHLMRDVDDDIYPPASTECEENWVEQTVRQMDIMISNAEAKGNHKALAAYSVAQESINLVTFELATA